VRAPFERRHGVAACLLLALGQAADARSRTDETPTGFRIVVHPENPEAFATREFVSDAFLKKTNRWPDGAVIRPVDHRFGSAVREEFSESVLRRSAAAVRNYWQQRIFAGRGVPPPEVGSDAEVIRYVREHQGGIGYVSAATDPSAVKVLSIR
jgi:ABC-type phosphate transport system substrate-binding protein